MERNPPIHRQLVAALASGMLLLLVILCAFCLFWQEIYTVPILDGDIYEMTDGWQIVAGSTGESVSDTLPALLPYDPEGYVLTATVRPPTDYPVVPTVLFLSNHMNFRLYLDDRLLRAQDEARWPLSKTPGNTYHIVRLPADYAGKDIRIELDMLLGDSLQYEVPPLQIAPKATIIYALFHADLTRIILDLLILTCGLILLLLHFPLKRKLHINDMMLFTGLFATAFAVYAFCETDIVHLLIENSYIIYLCDFMSLAMLPVPLLMLLQHHTAPRFRPLTAAAAFLNLGNVILQLILNFARIADLREMVFLTHMCILVSIGVALVVTFGSRQREYPSRTPFFLSLLPMLTGAIVDLILFYFHKWEQNSFFFQIGVLLFVLIQICFIVRTYLRLYSEHLQSDFYQRMAYTDALTGVGNRAAFERELDQLKDQVADRQAIWCISVDINNLKETNDTFGHAAGDQLIIGMSDILRSVMCELSEVYRTGGDEFILFVVDVDEAEIEKGRQRLRKALDTYNAAHAIPISFALGVDHFHYGEEDTIDRLLIRADARMYADKKKQDELTL